MKIVEVNGGYCRKPFECNFVPVPTYSSLFIDITNVTPQPDEYWSYDYKTKSFKEPEGDMNDHNSDYAIRLRWNDVRNQRQIYLVESDWTQLADCQLPWKEKRAWRKYRQELRDLPQKYVGQNPLFVVYPPRPTYTLKQNLIGRIKTFIKLLLKGNK
jgi:hypothetical protein